MPDKKERLIELDVHRRKLVLLVGDLLKNADDLDLSTRRVEGHSHRLPDRWHDQLAVVCKDLAALSEATGALDVLIKAGNLKRSQESLLRCVHIANNLSARLNALKAEAGE
jgi:hypothetical protein